MEVEACTALAAKIRGTDLGDLLITRLASGGTASRLSAIGAITLAEALAPSVAYLSAMTGSPPAERLAAPSRNLTALLSAIDLDQPPLVAREVANGKADLTRAFGIDDWPYGHSWVNLRAHPPGGARPPRPVPRDGRARHARHDGTDRCHAEPRGA